MRVLLVLGMLLLALLTGQRPGMADEMIDIRPGNFDGLSEEDMNRTIAMDMFLRMNPDAPMQDFVSLLELWDRESNWRTSAANPDSSARGIPQAMGSWHPETQTEEWLNDPVAQIRWGLEYIQKRYGSPTKALEHWNRQKELTGRGSY